MSDFAAEAEHLKHVAIDYASQLDKQLLDMTIADGFTYDRQITHITALATLHLVQLHLLRTRDILSSDIARQQRAVFADAIEAIKLWL